jgi:hypothetical protein
MFNRLEDEHVEGISQQLAGIGFPRSHKILMEACPFFSAASSPPSICSCSELRQDDGLPATRFNEQEGYSRLTASGWLLYPIKAAVMKCMSSPLAAKVCAA